MAKQFKERDIYVIPVWTKQLVPVSREVYIEWYKHKRYWQYLNEKDKSMGLCSLEDLFSNKKESVNCMPDYNTNIEEQVIKNEEKDALKLCLSKLPKDEFQLIDALFYQDITLRKYGDLLGLSPVGVMKKRDKILEKLAEEMTILCM